jgi:hypothetical protein
MWTEFGPVNRLGNANPVVMTSMATALWAADVLGRSARAGADGMLFYNLTLPAWRDNWNSWPSMLFANDFSKIYPTSYTYLMFGQWWGSNWVMDVSSNDEAKLSVNASVNGDRIYAMLINKTSRRDLLARVEIKHNGARYYLSYPTQAHSITLLTFEATQFWSETVIINDTHPGFSVQGDWREYTDQAGQHYGSTHRYNEQPGTGQDTATWSFTVPRPGNYNVYAWWWEKAYRPSDVPYTINYHSGAARVEVNQQINGGQWNLLGTFYFENEGSVVVSDDVSSGKDIVADAIRLVPQ